MRLISRPSGVFSGNISSLTSAVQTSVECEGHPEGRSTHSEGHSRWVRLECHCRSLGGILPSESPSGGQRIRCLSPEETQSQDIRERPQIYHALTGKMVQRGPVATHTPAMYQALTNNAVAVVRIAYGGEPLVHCFLVPCENIRVVGHAGRGAKSRERGLVAVADGISTWTPTRFPRPRLAGYLGILEQGPGTQVDRMLKFQLPGAMGNNRSLLSHFCLPDPAGRVL